MKPGDHPDFFRLAPPPGASRESTIRLDAQGRFWHDGVLVEKPALAAALHRWIARHPDDGRYILTNGYDWTYFEVEDVPYFVESIALEEQGIRMTLTDGAQEWLEPATLRGLGNGLYAKVKGGAFEARFSRHAQIALEPALEEGAEGEVVLKVAGNRYEIKAG
jgi:uncharacterized protein